MAYLNPKLKDEGELVKRLEKNTIKFMASRVKKSKNESTSNTSSPL